MDLLIDKVIAWADQRNLINGSDAKSQCLKLMSEVGELADHVNKKTDVRDDVGDCIVVLAIIAAQHGLTLTDCVAFAYDDIKDRQGVMLDGVFVKSTDEHYDHALAVIGARRVDNSRNQMAAEIMSK
mgnify:CR=1 FL=1